MPRYIDVDKAKELWNGEHPTQIAMRRIFDDLPTADVVPKSEFDRVANELARVEGHYFKKVGEVERLEQILNSYALQYGTVKDRQGVIDKAKSEVARGIFEEIEEYVIKGISVGGEHLTLFNGKNYAELKKKYMEGKA